jgi:nucleoside-diphosphate-sugar epimerase
MDDVSATPPAPSAPAAVPPSPPVAAERVLVTGAAGFIGGHTCRALTAAGYEVVGLVRKPLEDPEAVPGVCYVTGDVRYPSILSPETFAACRYVVHLVGIIAEIRSKGQTFEAVHVDGTRNILAMAKAAEDLHRFVYLSAQGASPQSRSGYSQTKAHAEQLVRDSGLPYTIFRPSLVIGPGGEFVAQIEGLIRRPPLTPFPVPFVPLPGSGENRFQPVYVEDLTAALVQSLTEPAARDQTFEIGGADVVTFNQLIEAFERHAGVKKPILHAPMSLMLAAASVLEALLPVPPVTVDQLVSLGSDNVCDNEAVKRALTVDPLPFEQTLNRVYRS